MAVGGAGAEEDIAHFLTIEDLARVHERIFEPGAALFLVGESINWNLTSTLVVKVSPRLQNVLW
jgi:hypothetical protein